MLDLMRTSSVWYTAHHMVMPVWLVGATSHYINHYMR